MTGDPVLFEAVASADAAFDGRFFYAVKTTGVFCRPSCKSRTPRRENVAFFDTAQDAMDAGYRPCKRCRPDLLAYRPALDIAEKTKSSIDNCFHERSALAGELAKLGVSQRRMAAIFRERYQMTPNEYADALRMQAARELLAGGEVPLIEVAMRIGFESVSAFYGFFWKHAQMAPGEYRKRRAAPREPMHQAYCRYETAVGSVGIGSDGSAVSAVRFVDQPPWSGEKGPDAITDEAARQIEAYLAGKRRRFDLPLRPAGTAFQQSVRQGLLAIPYGETRSYGQLARMIGNPGASRAVGMANNKNPLLMIIPCHRVIGSDGALVGYAGGLEIKKKLLELERSFSGRPDEDGGTQ